MLRSLATILIAFFLAVPLRAEEGQRVILVLDASGSMWGQINGKSKMEIAKDVVANVVGTWKLSDELGLVAYGHREKGSCDDIQVLSEPGALDASAYLKSVNGLNPKGKTPMTKAVRMAAESLKYTERKATVILVSDGIETCGLDPCAVADELERLGVELTVHTVGFGLDDKGAVAQLQCLAERTGGIAVTANNADELEDALKKTVAAAPLPPPEPAAPEFNLTGSVKMAENAELPEPYLSASWEVRQADSAGGPGAVVTTTYGKEIKINVEPGDYVMLLNTDLVKTTVPFKVEAGKTAEIKTHFNAGLVTFTATSDGTAVLQDPSLAWEVATPEGTWLGTKYGPSQPFMLAAGDYKVKLTLGAASVEQPFAVAPGEKKTVQVAMGAGKLTLSAIFAEGSEAAPDRSAFSVSKADPSGGKPTWVATQYNSKPVFDLAAGTYIATFELDLVKAEQQVEVKAGAITEVVLNAGAGYLSVSAPGATVMEVLSGEKGLDGKNKWIATDYAESINKAAKAGAYLVRAMKGEELIGEKLVEVKAGQRSEVTIP
ncbi:MAG: vWA domain-containing protein [Aestuariivirga sp.]